jgi:hypothetical protein
MIPSACLQPLLDHLLTITHDPSLTLRPRHHELVWGVSCGPPPKCPARGMWRNNMEPRKSLEINEDLNLTYPICGCQHERGRPCSNSFLPAQTNKLDDLRPSRSLPVFLLLAASSMRTYSPFHSLIHCEHCTLGQGVPRTTHFSIQNIHSRRLAGRWRC